MPKKIQNYGKAHLISVPLPTHGLSYTVISHESVIDMSTTALINAGFTIVEEEYRATADGQIAQGIYRLNYMGDPDLSMMFAWTNSYNKQVRFKCGVGAYVNKTGTVMVCGDIGSWARKHTGTADTETQDTIDDQISNAYMYYNQLVSDKASMETITMNKRKQAQMLGILFAEYQILTTEQASIIRSQMDRPTHVFTDSNSLWAFYNYVTLSLQYSHPKTWMEDQRILHHFISEVNKFAPVNTPVPVISAPVDPLTVIPNQTNLLDQIADLEADQMDEDVRYDANVTEELAAELYLAETTFMNARALELKLELETDAFAMAQLAGVRAPEDLEIKLTVPKTNEELAAEYNATHDDSQMNIEYLSPEEVKEKYGQEIVIHVESDQEYLERVADIEGELEVVQEEVIYAEDLHQSEEIILEADEDIEVPFDIDEDDDTVLGSLLVPIENNEPIVEEEIGQENSTSIFPQEETVIYTDTAGNTFEAPIVIEDLVIEEIPVQSTGSDFDLDLDFEDSSSVDTTPDFF
tara:strand:- start:5579 stop:7147 length:1569 start_codon:yes stop_codon:yes gene_type:complete